MSYRERGYEPAPYRGEHMMNDPTTANARVYVGNLPVADISKKDLEDRFRKHGSVLGVTLNNRGFGFVQYEEEDSALDAIKLENGANFKGKKIEVNQARVIGRVPGGPRRDDDRDRDRDRDRDFRDRSPMDDRDRDWRGDRSRDLHDRWSLRRDSSPARYEGYPRKDSLDRERERERERDRDRGFGARDREGPFSRQDNFRGGSGRDERAGGGFGKDSYDTYPGEPREPPSMSTVANVDRTNDCEIIVVQKEQREYAEYIEHRLKQIGLTVDLLFPNKEVPIIRVLANISSRGSLYAIVVMPQNEEHRSLTLNILHGQPQEHRNMPLEDAIPLITRNFEAYMRGEKLAGTVPLPVPVIPAAKPTGGLLERHPEAMQVLLNLLSDNRQLTTLQYDRVIIYLKDRREEQMKLELGDVDALRNAAGEQSTQKQVDLQHRILNILNNCGSGGPAPVPVPAVPASNWPPTSNSGGPTPLLSDPTVQKALDSLMQGNLLRSISSTQSLTTPTYTSASSLGAPPSQPLFGAFSSGGPRRY